MVYGGTTTANGAGAFTATIDVERTEEPCEVRSTLAARNCDISVNNRLILRGVGLAPSMPVPLPPGSPGGEFTVTGSTQASAPITVNVYTRTQDC